MPLPVIHSFTGYSVYHIYKKYGHKPYSLTALFFILLATIPDLDFILGLILGQGARFHRGPSHSLFAAFLIALLATMIYSLIRHKKSEARSTKYETNPKKPNPNSETLANEQTLLKAVPFRIFQFSNFGFPSDFGFPRPKDWRVRHALWRRISDLSYRFSREIRVFFLSFLAYATHVLLDMFSAYGVPLLWPFTDKIIGYPLSFFHIGRLGAVIHQIEGFQDFFIFIMSPAFLKPMFFELAIVFSIWTVATAVFEIRRRVRIRESVAFVRAIQASVFILGFMVT